jgi:hypothetical protein
MLLNHIPILAQTGRPIKTLYNPIRFIVAISNILQVELASAPASSSVGCNTTTILTTHGITSFGHGMSGESGNSGIDLGCYYELWHATRK